MKKIVFTEPVESGEIENPNIEWLKNLIFNKGDDFWDVGAEQGGVNFFENDSDEWAKCYLSLKGLEKYGFMIDYVIDHEYHTLKFGERTGETVEASIGGNPHLYYREYFVTREMAWEAIEYFMEKGEMKPSLKWEIAEMPEQEF
jgi:hypothetical protein